MEGTGDFAPASSALHPKSANAARVATLRCKAKCGSACSTREGSVASKNDHASPRMIPFEKASARTERRRIQSWWQLEPSDMSGKRAGECGANPAASTHLFPRCTKGGSEIHDGRPSQDLVASPQVRVSSLGHCVIP